MVVIFGWEPARRRISARRRRSPVRTATTTSSCITSGPRSGSASTSSRWSRTELTSTLCPICRHGLQLKPGQQHAVNEMRASTSRFRRRALEPGPLPVAGRAVLGGVRRCSSGQQVLWPAPRFPPPASAAAEPPGAVLRSRSSSGPGRSWTRTGADRRGSSRRRSDACRRRGECLGGAPVGRRRRRGRAASR